MKFTPPLLTEGPLSGRVYVVTHGEIEPHPTIEGETMVLALVKYDVTDQFNALAERRTDGATELTAPQAGQSEASMFAFAAGFDCALRGIELYDAERARLGRALTEDEVRRCAEVWANPIRFVPPRTEDGS